MPARWFFLVLFPTISALAQQYDLLLRGGHVIDPASAIDAVMDVAISGTQIAAVEAHIPESLARKTVDITGLHVLPGLVDLHAHVFGYSGSLPPDETALVAGTTTVVDAGGSGWRTFDNMRRTVVKNSKTRVLASINIVGAGMAGDAAESDTADMEPARTAETIQRNRDVIVGVKTAHFARQGWTAIDRAVEAGRLAGVPVMVDDRILTNSGRTTRDKVLDHLRPGDIHTHMYNDRQLELIDRATGEVQPYMREARRRGVLFDLGHGAGSFLWPVASRAMAQGFGPDTISTDVHDQSILVQQPDMPNCMSKLMLLGMPLGDAVARATVSPAKAIGRYPEIGTLGVGRTADIAVLELAGGVFAFKDAWGAKRLGTKRLECVLTVRNGAVVYDRGYSRSSTAGNREIYDLLLKNGRVVDPANRRSGRMDIAVIGGKIARVAPGLPASHARTVVEAGEYYVAPGLIDLYAEVEGWPDHRTLPGGITTAVDVSGSGWRLGERAKTRVLGWLNMDRPERLEPEAAADIARKHRDVIVGITADSPEQARKAAGLSGTVAAPAARQRLPGAIAEAMATGGSAVEQVIARFTSEAAQAIRRPDLGALSEGAVADIAVLEAQGPRLRCVLTVRNGLVVWDSEGLAAPDWIRAGPYSNYK